MNYYKSLIKLYSVTWGGGGSDMREMKKNTIIYYYSQWGCAKNDKLKEFMLALKSTRIRRLFHSPPNLINILETEMNTSISNLWSRGTEYTIKICKLMHNSF